MKELIIGNIAIENLKTNIKKYKNKITNVNTVLLNFINFELLKISKEKYFINTDSNNIVFDKKEFDKLFEVTSNDIFKKIIEYTILIDKFLILNYSSCNEHNKNYIINYSYINNNIPQEIEEVIFEFDMLIEQLLIFTKYLNFLKENQNILTFIKENFKTNEIDYFNNFLKTYFIEISLLNNKKDTIRNKLFKLKKSFLNLMKVFFYN